MSLPHAPISSALRRAVPLTALALLTVTLAACAPQATDSELSGNDALVEDAITRLQDRAGKDDAAGICRQAITEELQAKFAKVGGGDCTKGVEASLLRADYTALKVLKVTGQTRDKQPTVAVATIDTIEDAGTREITVRKVGKVYLVDSFNAKPAKVAASTPERTTPEKTTTPES